jgi:hypothetical protein
MLDVDLFVECLKCHGSAMTTKQPAYSCIGLGGNLELLTLDKWLAKEASDS